MEHETRAKGDLCFLRLPRRACMVLLTRFVLAFASFRRHCLKTRKITPVRQARCVETSAAEKNSHVFQTSLHCSTLKLIHRLPKPTSGTKEQVSARVSYAWLKWSLCHCHRGNGSPFLQCSFQYPPSGRLLLKKPVLSVSYYVVMWVPYQSFVLRHLGIGPVHKTTKITQVQNVWSIFHSVFSLLVYYSWMLFVTWTTLRCNLSGHISNDPA